MDFIYSMNGQLKTLYIIFSGFHVLFIMDKGSILERLTSELAKEAVPVSEDKTVTETNSNLPESLYVVQDRYVPLHNVQDESGSLHVVQELNTSSHVVQESNTSSHLVLESNTSLHVVQDRSESTHVVRDQTDSSLDMKKFLDGQEMQTAMIRQMMSEFVKVKEDVKHLNELR